MAAVIAVVSGKGGVSKTTTAVNLAAQLSDQFRVLLVDSDPQNAGSVEYWFQGDQPEGFSWAKDARPELLAQLSSVTEYDLVVVDTPPQLGSDILRAVAEASDIVIVSTTPDPADIIAAVQTIHEIPPATLHRVLLTQVDARAMSEAEDALATMRENNVPTLDSRVRLLKVHRRAKNSQRVVNQMGGFAARRASAEYRAVAAEVLALVEAALHERRTAGVA